MNAGQHKVPSRCAHLLAIAIVLIPALLWGQAKPAAPKTTGKLSSTQISVDLITGDEGMGLRANRWYQAFERMGIPLKIRRSMFDDKVSVTEKTLGGSIRQIYVVGKLDKNGQIQFADRSFGEGDTAKMAEWFKDLKTYGAQGSPKGQPLWGLSKVQFELIFNSLNSPLLNDLKGKDLNDAIASFALPRDYSLQFTTSARKLLDNRTRSQTMRQSLQGVAKGAALAAALNEHGLGFRPRRTPAGNIELNVYPLSETTDVWPVGWPLPPQRTGPQVAPKLYAPVPVNLEDIELDDVLDAAGDTIGVPILIDYAGMTAKKIDLSIKVSFPAKRTTWFRVLKELAFKARATTEIYIDEAGKPFVWVTPLGAKRPGIRDTEKE